MAKVGDSIHLLDAMGYLSLGLATCCPSSVLAIPGLGVTKRAYVVGSMSQFQLQPTCFLRVTMSGILSAMPDYLTEQQVPQHSTPDNSELSRLLSAVVAQDKLAFEALYQTTVDRLFGLALRITRSGQGAEEVLSDVYLQVWQTADRYSAERGSVMAWLSIICRSRALDYLRKSQRIADQEEPLENIQYEGNEAIAQDLLEAVEQDSALHEVLLSLDVATRQLLALAYFRDYSHSELSHLTGKPIGTVKTQIRRAIIELNKRMCSSTDSPGATL